MNPETPSQMRMRPAENSSIAPCAVENWNGGEAVFTCT